MLVNTSRFGTLDIDGHDVVRFPAGIIGFPQEHEFVLLRRRESSPVAWLQSIATPWLALPVVSASAIEGAYAGAVVEGSIESLGLEFKPESCAMLVVLHVPPAPLKATVNLLAPIVINSQTRAGAQVLIEGSGYSTQEPFVLRASEVRPATEEVRPPAEETREAPVLAAASAV